MSHKHSEILCSSAGRCSCIEFDNGSALARHAFTPLLTAARAGSCKAACVGVRLFFQACTPSAIDAYVGIVVFQTVFSRAF